MAICDTPMNIKKIVWGIVFAVLFLCCFELLNHHDPCMKPNQLAAHSICFLGSPFGPG